jgi:hypothetical protein
MARGINQVESLSGLFNKLVSELGGDTTKASQIFGKYLNNPDVYENLVKQGAVKTVVPSVTSVESMLASAIPAAGAATAGIAAPIVAAAQGGGGGLLSSLGGFAAATGANFFAEKLANSAGGIAGPTSYATAEPTGASKYLVSPETGMSYQQYYESVLPRIRATNAIFRALGQAELPEPETPQEFVQRSADVLSQQQEEATNRMIRQTRANREYDAIIQSLASQGQVATEREKSLGAVQRQRVESGYNAASSMLNQVIKDIGARERYENNTTLAQLAQPV